MDLAQLVQDVIDGNESPLKAYGILKNQQKFLEKCLEEIKDVVLLEAEKQENNFNVDGFSFEKRKGRAIFNFKNIPAWNEANEKLKGIENQAKAAYQNYSKGLMNVTVDGEEVMLPEVTYSNDVLILKVLL